MPELEPTIVAADTSPFVSFTARVVGVQPGDVIAKAVALLIAVERDAPVAVYADYAGRRVTGAFNPTTRRVRVTSDPLPGAQFRSPSGAARAVIAALNPERRKTDANGWHFWRTDPAGQHLDVYRH